MEQPFIQTNTTFQPYKTPILLSNIKENLVIKKRHELIMEKATSIEFHRKRKKNVCY